MPLEISLLNWEDDLWEPLKMAASPEDDEVIIVLNEDETARYFNIQEKKMDLQVVMDEPVFNQVVLTITGDFVNTGAE